MYIAFKSIGNVIEYTAILNTGPNFNGILNNLETIYPRIASNTTSNIASKKYPINIYITVNTKNIIDIPIILPGVIHI